MSTETNSNKKSPWRDRDTLRQLYVEEDESVEAIAAKFNCTSRTIYHWLNRHDISNGDERTSHYQVDELIEKLQWLNQGLAGRPTQTDIDASDGPSWGVYCRHFESFAKALTAADITPSQPTTKQLRSDQTTARDTLPTSMANYLKGNPEHARVLLQTEDPFHLIHTELSQSAIHGLKNTGVIRHANDTKQRVESPTRIDSKMSRRWEWECAPGVREWIRNNIILTSKCPGHGCNSSGIRNRPNKTGDNAYTCSNSSCDETFDRATAAKIVGHKADQ